MGAIGGRCQRLTLQGAADALLDGAPPLLVAGVGAGREEEPGGDPRRDDRHDADKEQEQSDKPREVARGLDVSVAAGGAYSYC